MSANSRALRLRPSPANGSRPTYAFEKPVADRRVNSLSAAVAKLAAVQKSAGSKGWLSSKLSPKSFQLLGVRIDNISMTAAIGCILDAAHGMSPSSFAFVNADCLNIACGDPRYTNILADQQAVFADGSGIALASRLRGITIRENVNGTDMFPLLCQAAAASGLSIFLLGAEPGIAGRVAANMSAEFQDLSIAGTHHGFFDNSEEDSVITMINQSGADILLVAMGAPRQEVWIAANRNRLAPKVAIGVGGLFDFFSGRVWRAPVAMRRTGLEWVWRLGQEPGRLWRRYVLGNPLFLVRCIREQVVESLSQLSDAPRAAAHEALLLGRDKNGGIGPSAAGTGIVAGCRS